VQRLLLALILASGLAGCTGYPRLLGFPFDSGGRSLNSPTAEVQPSIGDRYIAFSSDRNGSQDIYLFDAQNRRLVELRGLNSLDEIATHPSISEDGRYLVFLGSRRGKSDIYLYDRQTEQKRNLTEGLEAEVRNPHLSANGERVAFEVAQEGQWDIWIYSRTGQRINTR
jgi:Tol biopolymer transport system component